MGIRKKEYNEELSVWEFSMVGEGDNPCWAALRASPEAILLEGFEAFVWRELEIQLRAEEAKLAATREGSREAL